MSVLMNIWTHITHLFMPSCCLACGGDTGSAISLCAGCSADLPWMGHACPTCAEPLAAPAPACARCQRNPPPCRTIVPLRFEGRARELVHRLKFENDLAAGAVLADILGGTLVTRAGPVAAVVPVPMPAARIRARGFNQASVLSAPLARRLGIAHLPALCERSGNPAPQREMPDAAARRRNVRGTFAARGRCPDSVAIVDDVVTTGSTVTALALCLLAAGASSVEVWAVARGSAGRSGVEVGH